MKALLAAFFCGVIFAVGLGISGMAEPRNVLAFLELRDFSLMLVMGSAVLVTLFGFPIVLSRRKPQWAAEFCVPAKKTIDRRLIFGAILFGLGWGLVGLCPGPALVGLVTLNPKIAIFTVAMAIGLLGNPFQATEVASELAIDDV